MKTDDDRRREVTSPTPYVKCRLKYPFLMQFAQDTDDMSEEEQILKIALVDAKHWYEFFARKKAPNANDWLADGNPGEKEREGQSFHEYFTPFLQNAPDAQHMTIGLQCIGNLSSIKLNYCNSQSNANNIDSDEKDEKQSIDNNNLNGNSNSLMKMLSEVVSYFFDLPVKLLNDMPTKNITSRLNDSSQTIQLKTGSIFPKLTKISNEKEKNLCCLMGVSIMDLYPKDDWNVCFASSLQLH